jgi:hypothetical protein
MAYQSKWNNNAATPKDTGWGLIYRLNLIMGKIENDLETSNLDKWNLHIDRIYANIMFKDQGEYVYDNKGNILDIKFSKEDVEMFQRFAQQIRSIQQKINTEKMKEEPSPAAIHIYKDQLYSVLFKKDMWIRKIMFTLKLYLRENESDPRKAIYGG